jgi:hypothetical protein
MMWIAVAIPRFDPVTMEPVPGASPQAYIVAGMLLNGKLSCMQCSYITLHIPYPISAQFKPRTHIIAYNFGSHLDKGV